MFFYHTTKVGLGLGVKWGNGALLSLLQTAASLSGTCLSEQHLGLFFCGQSTTRAYTCTKAKETRGLSMANPGFLPADLVLSLVTTLEVEVEVGPLSRPAGCQDVKG